MKVIKKGEENIKIIKKDFVKVYLKKINILKL